MKKREYEAHYKGILDDKKSELLKESENFLIEYEKARRAEIDAQIFEYEQNLRMQTIAPLKNRIHFLKMELEKGLLQENYHKELEIHDLNMVIISNILIIYLILFFNREFQMKEIIKI